MQTEDRARSWPANRPQHLDVGLQSDHLSSLLLFFKEVSTPAGFKRYIPTSESLPPASSVWYGLHTMTLFQILLLSVLYPLLALTQSGYSVCFGDGSICDARDAVTCVFDENDAENLKYYECTCGNRLPLEQA